MFQELLCFLFQVPSQLTMGLYAIVTSGHGLIENAYRLIVLCFYVFLVEVTTMYLDIGYGLINYDCALINMGMG